MAPGFAVCRIGRKLRGYSHWSSRLFMNSARRCWWKVLRRQMSCGQPSTRKRIACKDFSWDSRRLQARCSILRRNRSVLFYRRDARLCPFGGSINATDESSKTNRWMDRRPALILRIAIQRGRNDQDLWHDRQRQLLQAATVAFEAWKTFPSHRDEFVGRHDAQARVPGQESERQG